MKTSIKEAFEIVKKALPDHKISVSVKLDEIWTSLSDPERSMKWELQAKSPRDNDYIYGNDEIFAIALANIVAEAGRSRMKPAEDVVVEQDKKEEPERDLPRDPQRNRDTDEPTSPAPSF